MSTFWASVVRGIHFSTGSYAYLLTILDHSLIVPSISVKDVNMNYTLFLDIRHNIQAWSTIL